MRDPVTVVESGLTYDRQSLCASLLMYPDLEPGTGQRFDRPLHYTPSVAVRSLVMAKHGDSYYQKYDDGDFKAQYEAKWKDLCPPSAAVTKEQPSSLDGVDVGSARNDPTPATSGTSGRDPTDMLGARDVLLDTANACSVEGSKNGTQDPDSGLDRIDTLRSDDDDDLEAAASRGVATKLDQGGRSCWRSRRGRMLIVGAAVLVVGVIVVGLVVGVSKPAPASIDGPDEGGSNSTPTTAESTSASIEACNSTLPPRTIDSLRNKSSPQYRAYEWVTQSDQVPGRDEPNDAEKKLFRMTQRFALATLFYSIAGLGGWVDLNESECRWGKSEGAKLTCHGDSHLIALDPVRAANGTGTIPAEIGLLTDLVRLYLDGKSLTSTIPIEVRHLSALTTLSCSGNQLTYTIPTELRELSALRYLSLGTNDLTSSIPTELGQLSALTTLSLRENALTSSIPTELGQLSALRALNLGFNFITSTIPTELGQLSALTELYLNDNPLTSTIPTELGQLSELDRLDLWSTGVTGTFPSALCSANLNFLALKFRARAADARLDEPN